MSIVLTDTKSGKNTIHTYKNITQLYYAIRLLNNTNVKIYEKLLLFTRVFLKIDSIGKVKINNATDPIKLIIFIISSFIDYVQQVIKVRFTKKDKEFIIIHDSVNESYMIIYNFSMDLYNMKNIVTMFKSKFTWGGIINDENYYIGNLIQCINNINNITFISLLGTKVSELESISIVRGLMDNFIPNDYRGELHEVTIYSLYPTVFTILDPINLHDTVETEPIIFNSLLNNIQEINVYSTFTNKLNKDKFPKILYEYTDISKSININTVNKVKTCKIIQKLNSPNFNILLSNDINNEIKYNNIIKNENISIQKGIDSVAEILNNLCSNITICNDLISKYAIDPDDELINFKTFFNSSDYNLKYKPVLKSLITLTEKNNIFELINIYEYNEILDETSLVINNTENKNKLILSLLDLNDTEYLVNIKELFKILNLSTIHKNISKLNENYVANCFKLLKSNITAAKTNSINIFIDIFYNYRLTTDVVFDSIFNTKDIILYKIKYSKEFYEIKNSDNNNHDKFIKPKDIKIDVYVTEDDTKRYSFTQKNSAYDCVLQNDSLITTSHGLLIEYQNKINNLKNLNNIYNQNNANQLNILLYNNNNIIDKLVGLNITYLKHINIYYDNLLYVNNELYMVSYLIKCIKNGNIEYIDKYNLQKIYYFISNHTFYFFNNTYYTTTGYNTISDIINKNYLFDDDEVYSNIININKNDY